MLVIVCVKGFGEGVKEKNMCYCKVCAREYRVSIIIGTQKIIIAKVDVQN